MLKGFPDKVEVVKDSENFLVKLKKCLKEEKKTNSHMILQRKRLASGLVKVLPMSDRGIMTIQLTEEKENLKEVESTMAMFYTSQVEEIHILDLHRGSAVAALYTDLAWHRGEVVEVKESTKMVVVEYVDWGWRGEVKINAVRRLDDRFYALPCQIVTVRCKGIDIINRSWEEAIKQGNMEGKVVADETGVVYMDLYTCKNEKTQVEKASSKSPQLAKWSGCHLDQQLAMRKLITDSLARLREKERVASAIAT